MCNLSWLCQPTIWYGWSETAACARITRAGVYTKLRCFFNAWWWTEQAAVGKNTCPFRCALKKHRRALCMPLYFPSRLRCVPGLCFRLSCLYEDHLVKDWWRCWLCERQTSFVSHTVVIQHTVDSCPFPKMPNQPIQRLSGWFPSTSTLAMVISLPVCIYKFNCLQT